MNGSTIKSRNCCFLIAFTCIGLLGWSHKTYGAEDYSQWAHACTITLNTSASGANVTTAQAGFPVLIRLTNAITAFTFGDAMSGGQDLRFAKSDGTHLPYQIERFDQGNQLAEIWVKVDVNGNDNTQFITMYWGKAGSADSSNGAAVFSNGFLVAAHLNETGNSSSGGYLNAASAGNGTGSGMVSGDETSGIIARGQNFSSIPLTADAAAGQAVVTIAAASTSRFAVGEAVAVSAGGGNSEYKIIQSIDAGTGTITLTTNLVNAYTVAAGSFLARFIRIPSGVNLNAVDFTMSGWVKTTALNGQQYFLNCATVATPNQRFSLGINNTNFYCTKYGDGSVTSPADLNWHYVVATWTNATLLQTLYVDGASVGTHTSGSTNAINGECTIGWRETPNSYEWNGSVDEACVANVARSADWIRLCYQSQMSGASWLSFSSVTVSPPSITSDPSNTTVNAGQTASFTVGASGGGLTYQWQRYVGAAWQDVAGATTATYSFTTAYPTDNGAQFRCHVHNSMGDAYSNAATLTVTCNPPSITQQPLAQSVAAGQNAVFIIGASGQTGYQWQRSNDHGGTWVNVTTGSGGTTNTYTLSTVAGDSGAQFRCQVSNSCGTINSNAVILSVGGCPAPTISSPPHDTTAEVGQTVSFSVTTSGSGLTYQWERSPDGSTWNPVGTNSATFSLTVQSTDNNTRFHCKVTNVCGTTTSYGALLVVCTPPSIATQPAPWTGIAGSTASFSCSVPPAVTSPTYQWQRNDIGGTWGSVPAGNGSGTTTNYTFTAQAADNGISFRCFVTGACSPSVYTNAVTASVCSPPTTTNPSNQSVLEGQPATFSVTAGGGVTYRYQWQYSLDSGVGWSSTSAADTFSTLTFSTLALQNGYRYRCEVWNGCGATPAISTAAVLAVCAPAHMFSQPGNQDKNVGDTAMFTVTATGSLPITFQWQRSPDGTTWANATTGSGGTTNTYTLVTAGSDNNAKFRCMIQNSCGKDSSAVVTLSVCTPPVITVPPHDTNVNPGALVSFKVSVSGTNLTYQWQRSNDGGLNWSIIAGATAPTCTLTTVALDNGAKFMCIVTSKCGSINSSIATLIVCVPVKVTAQNIGRDSVLVGAPITYKMTANGSAVRFQWQKSTDGTTFTPVAGDTLDSISFAAAKSDSGVTWNCVVSGQCGAPITSNPGKVLVYTPVKAAFGLFPPAGIAPLAVTFVDSSTGDFTKRIWAFGDSSTDTNFSGNKSVTHNFNTANNFNVKLLVSGPGGTDTITKQVFTYPLGSDPIQITGSYLTPTKMQIRLTNYGTLTPPAPSIIADSVGLWYKVDSLPATQSQGTFVKWYLPSDLRGRGSEYYDTIPVPALTGSDSVYGITNAILWSDHSYSTFLAGNGFLVLMRDTARVTNDIRISGTYVPDDTALVRLDNVDKIDTLRIDSVGLWYSLTGDTVADFTDKNFTTWLKPAVLAKSGTQYMYPIVNTVFNSEQRTIAVAVIQLGFNRTRSPVNTYKFVVGKPRPANPIHLTARALSPNRIRLTWNNIASAGVERIFIWVRPDSAVPLAIDVTSLNLDTLVPSVADTTIVGSKFNEQTRYYFGAQVYKGGLWSFITAAASANDSTPAALAKLDSNTVRITSLTFDTTVNQIKVCWTLNPIVAESLQVGILYSPDSMPLVDNGNQQVVDVTGISACAYVKLREDLMFDHTYYVSMWLRRPGGKWTDPDPKLHSKDSIHVPLFTWQSVTYSRHVNDTVFAFNNNLRFTNTPDDQSNTPNIVYLRQPDTSWLAGFIPVSIGFEFSNKSAGIPFYVGLKVQSVPTG
ncbi:MAG TPA: DUF2341 domain-containing protein, partial [Chitinivibrionales bacterium]|nr:DUF2341 domain-containing protein [Chitinivibrionales bacterium]